MEKKDYIKANEIIDRMIGSIAEQRANVNKLSLSDRIKSNDQYDKMRAKLLAIADVNGVEYISGVTIMCGGNSRGFTKTGRKYTWEGNCGITAKSLYCGSLWIDGEGTVFTSGTIVKAVEYILKY